eukprot:TRINITY_DN7150_c0_g1_i13.p1 TRINITY_DN7150_c0_g1~~TRINITY_DN7150_c0_g1_i13.p1  ORF type:complete len:632 (+),score=140.61 TRINITY_DN7150_c0_g1_i13:25-1896(+)
MIRRPPRSTHCISSAASDVYKRQVSEGLKIEIQLNPSLTVASNFTSRLKIQGNPATVSLNSFLSGNKIVIDSIPIIAADDNFVVIVEGIMNPAKAGNYSDIFVVIVNKLDEVLMNSKELTAEIINGRCMEGCVLCSTKVSCAVCEPSYKRWNGTCLVTCPKGTLEIDEACVPCADKCKSCETTTDFCTSCEQGKFNYKGECYEECAEGTGPLFDAGVNCMPCPKGCQRCVYSEGQLEAGVCAKCLSGYILSSKYPFACTLEDKEEEEMLIAPTTIAEFAIILIVAAIGKFSGDLTIDSNCIVVMSYMATYSHVIQLIYSLSKKQFFVFFGTLSVMVFQRVLNAVFVLKGIRGLDEEFRSLAHSRVYAVPTAVVLFLSLPFTLQTARVFFAEFMDVRIFHSSIGDNKSFKLLLSRYSVIQAFVIELLLLGVDMCGLVNIAGSTKLRSALAESAALTFALLALLLRNSICTQLDMLKDIATAPVAVPENAKDQDPSKIKEMDDIEEDKMFEDLGTLANTPQRGNKLRAVDYLEADISRADSPKRECIMEIEEFMSGTESAKEILAKNLALKDKSRVTPKDDQAIQKDKRIQPKKISKEIDIDDSKLKQKEVKSSLAKKNGKARAE